MKKQPAKVTTGTARRGAIVGDGITARELPTLETAIESWSGGNGKNDFDRRVRIVEAWAIDVAKRAGIEKGVPYNFLVDSIESIAARILREIEVIRNSIAAGDAAAAARGAVELGIEMGAASIKFQWEKYALKGKLLSPQRGPAQLTLEIEGAILALGENASPSNVEKYLSNRGVVHYDKDTGDIVWENAKGEEMRLKYHSFETKISAIKNPKK